MLRRISVALLFAWFSFLPAVAHAQNTLASGDCLHGDESRTSNNGRYTLYYQADGNLVLYDTSGNWSSVWATMTFSSPGSACMQSGDGNFVVSDSDDVPLWSSGTYGNGGAYLEVDDTGAIVIRQPDGSPIWGAPFVPQNPVDELVVLVNGSFDSNPSWMQPGSGEYSAIAGTYGISPIDFHWTDNSLSGILPPYYSGIVNGGFALANFLNALPPGDVSVIAHSHGGNVAIMSRAFTSRPVRSLIQLATPVNWDFDYYRYVFGTGVTKRCQVSSSADWVQFSGSSPYQIVNFGYAVYYSISGAVAAFQALSNGDYDTAYVYFAQSVFETIQADYWLDTTRIEVEGPTYMFGGLGHSDLHEPPVWAQIAGPCR